MVEHFLSFYKTKFKFIVPYIGLVLISLLLKPTPVNACSPRDGVDFCFGQVDFMLLLLSLPGWLTWLSLNLLPDFLKFTILNSIIDGLNTLSVNFNWLFLPSSFILTGFILYIAGLVSERVNRDVNNQPYIG